MKYFHRTVSSFSPIFFPFWVLAWRNKSCFCVLKGKSSISELTWVRVVKTSTTMRHPCMFPWWWLLHWEIEARPAATQSLLCLLCRRTHASCRPGHWCRLGFHSQGSLLRLFCFHKTLPMFTFQLCGVLLSEACEWVFGIERRDPVVIYIGSR